MKSKKLKYVPLEFDAFMTDPDFVAMSPFERGIYCSLILWLYSSSGSIKNNGNLHVICNCTKEEFEKTFSKISFKFRIKKDKIFHKKVTKVLAKQKKFLQNAKISGLRGAKVTWGAHRGAHRDPMANETRTRNDKENNSNSKSNNHISRSLDEIQKRLTSNNSNSTCSPARSSNSHRSNTCHEEKAIEVYAVAFIEKLNKTLHAKTRADRTCFNNVTKFLAAGCRSGRFKIGIFEQAIEYAKEARSGDNPNALFMSLMRSQLGYRRPKI